MYARPRQLNRILARRFLLENTRRIHSFSELPLATVWIDVINETRLSALRTSRSERASVCSVGGSDPLTSNSLRVSGKWSSDSASFSVVSFPGRLLEKTSSVRYFVLARKRWQSDFLQSGQILCSMQDPGRLLGSSAAGGLPIILSNLTRFRVLLWLLDGRTTVILSSAATAAAFCWQVLSRSAASALRFALSCCILITLVFACEIVEQHFLQKKQILISTSTHWKQRKIQLTTNSCFCRIVWLGLNRLSVAVGKLLT